MLKIAESAVPAAELVARYEKNKKIYATHKLTFRGVDGYDVYNITAPFSDGDNVYIAGRVEKRDTEICCVRFFRRISATEYELAYPETTFQRMQDPCVTHIGGELVIGGTAIDVDPLDENHIIGWRTLYFKGKSIPELKFWREGPHKMKDIRLGDYHGKLLVLSRPQGYEAGMGKIGFLRLDTPEQLDYRIIETAKISSVHFIEGEWGGANEMHPLKNGLIGVLGHIACRGDAGKLNYRSMTFCFDPKTLQSSGVKIIAERSDFAPGPQKKDYLGNVLFSGGLIRKEGGRAELYTGVSDCEAHFAEIDDPFDEYEAW